MIIILSLHTRVQLGGVVTVSIGYPSPWFHSLLPKYARLITEYSTRVGEGDEVLVSGTTEVLPLLREIYRWVLRLGGYPAIYIRDPLATEVFYLEASEDQLQHVTPLLRTMYEDYNVHITILGNAHTRSLTGIPGDKIALAQKSMQPLIKKYLEEAAMGEKRWTVAPYPTLADSQEADMRPFEYEEFVARATKIVYDDPIGEWVKQGEKQERIIVEVLGKADEIRVVNRDTDLLVKVSGRRWINDDGHENMPGGEVFTGPIEDATEGCITFNMPQVFQGRLIEGVRLCFKNGRVVDYKALRGEDLLARLLTIDEGASRLGEFAFGLNYDITRQTKEILFDEKIGGTIHIALGSGYPETGSLNQSAIHWDLILDMRLPEARVYVDGDLVYENGRFHAWED